MSEQTRFDLRKDIAWALYTDPRSETFNNAYKSALKANYSEDHAKTITLEKWWKHNVKMLEVMLPLAEKGLVEDLEIPKKSTAALRRIRADAIKFVASTVGRQRYHTKTEIETNSSLSLIAGNPMIDKLFSDEV